MLNRYTRRASATEKGQTSIEFIGLLPIIFFAGVVAFQGLIIFSVGEKIERAAYNGSRVASRGGDGIERAYKDLPEMIREQDPPDEPHIYLPTDGRPRLTIEAKIPVILTGGLMDIPLTATVEMPD